MKAVEIAATIGRGEHSTSQLLNCGHIALCSNEIIPIK